MSDQCKWPMKCNGVPGKNGYCFMHNKLVGGAPTVVAKPPKEIPKESAKRKVEKVKLKKIMDKKKKIDPRCKIKSPDCTGMAQGADHLQKASPANYTDEDNVIPACNACNLYKELNPLWAEQNGFAISRFKKTNK